MAKPFDEVRIVRRMDTFGMGFPMGLLQPLSFECLRCLSQPQRTAVNGSLDDMIRINLFDSVPHRKGNDGGSLFIGHRDDIIDHLTGEKRPDSIVHQHNFRLLRYVPKRLPNRILPFKSTRYDFPDLGEPMLFHKIIDAIVEVRYRNGEDNLVDGVCSLKDSQRMDDERLATQ